VPLESPRSEVVRLFESTMTAPLPNDDDLDRDYGLTHSSRLPNLDGRDGDERPPVYEERDVAEPQNDEIPLGSGISGSG
jgi:hypothetical protein